MPNNKKPQVGNKRPNFFNNQYKSAKYKPNLGEDDNPAAKKAQMKDKNADFYKKFEFDANAKKSPQTTPTSGNANKSTNKSTPQDPIDIDEEPIHTRPIEPPKKSNKSNAPPIQSGKGSGRQYPFQKGKWEKKKNKLEERLEEMQESDDEDEQDDITQKVNGSFMGLTFAVTGNFINITRAKMEAFIEKHKGKVHMAISKKTHFLVMGETLEDGRRGEEGMKFKKASSFGTTIYREPEFERFCKQRLRNPDFVLGRCKEKILGAQHVVDEDMDDEDETGNVNDISDHVQKRQKTIGESASPEKSLFHDGESHANIESRVAGEISYEQQLWVDKYQPKRAEDLVGNKEVIKKFIEWLQDWDDVIINGRKKTMIPKKGQNYANIPNVNARACMITGPPGVGKSSMVSIIAQELGFGIRVINAADKRSKSVIESMLKELSESTTMDFFIKKTADERKDAIKQQKEEDIKKKTVIVMDEIDGCGSSDRGGIGALIKVIKSTRMPIVCIANDHSSRKIVSLLNSCYDLKFQKPSANDIVRRLGMIAKAEGLRIELTALEQIIEFSGNDIRQIVNLLQLWKTKSKKVETSSVREKKEGVQKDQKIMMNAFSAIAKLFSFKDSRILKYHEKLNLFFIDFSLMPLLAFENYLTTFFAGQDKQCDLERMATCADLFSMGDNISYEIFNNACWGMLPDLGRIGVIAPASLLHGFIPFTKFPEMMGKFSSSRKSARLIRELKETGGHSLYASKMAVQNETIPLIYENIVCLLEDKANKDTTVHEAAQILYDLKFTMDQFKENVMGLLVSEKKMALFNDVDSNMKAAFTRSFNSMNQSSIKAKKSTGRGGGGGGAGGGMYGSKFDPDIQDHASDHEQPDTDDDKSDTEVVANKAPGANKSKKASAASKKPPPPQKGKKGSDNKMQSPCQSSTSSKGGKKATSFMDAPKGKKK